MPAKHDPDDTWGQAVTLVTGYAVPSRKTLFDTLSSKDHIPLMRGGLEILVSTSLTANNFTALVGWHTQQGEDYDLAFVDAGGDGKHDYGTLYQATLVFIGVPVDGNGRARLLDGGESMSGGKFTGSQGDEWDFTPLGQYAGGSRAALQKLLTDGTTRGFSYNGYDVLNGEAVDANSFERTGLAFDRTMAFFKNHATTLAQWETSLGEENSAWRGQAAGLFWHLIHQLRTNYDDYVDQLGGTGFTAAQNFSSGHAPQSKLSEALAKAEAALRTAATDLNTAWTTWASDGRHDPHRILMEVLDKVSAWVLENNIKQTTVYADESTYSYRTSDNFKQNHPTYGNLKDYPGAWKKMADDAVAVWDQHVEDVLVAAASTVLTNLKTAWSELEDAFEELETKDTSTLTEQYEEDRRDILEEQANQNQENLNNSLTNLGENLNNLGNGLGDGLNNLGDNLGNSLNGLGDGLGDSLNNLGDGLGDSLGGLGDGLTNLGNGLGDGLNLGGLGDGLGSGLGDGLDTGLGTGLGLGLGLGGTDDGNDATKGSTVTNPDGSTTTLNPDGTLTTRYPDGTTQLLDPETGIIKTTAPDGTVTTGDLTVPGGHTNPDGSVTSLNPDGTITTRFPDGTVTTIDPDTGQLTTTNPDGSVETGNISTSGLGDGLGDLDLTSPPTLIPPTTSSSSLDLSELGNLGDGLVGSSSSLGSSLGDGTSGLTSSSLLGGDYGSGNYADYDDGEDSTSDLLSGGALGAPLGASAGAGGSADSSGGAGSGGTPLFPGMGGMGGMGGGGAGGGGNGSSERVRNVLTEPGGTGGRRGGGRGGSRRGATEDEELTVTRGRGTSTSSGAGYPVGGPGGAGQGNRSTESGDRDRQSWMAEPEDEDVWGTDEGGAPAVIGR
ncbi:AAWKG family protein [Streptomyces geranii]|uniref:AAWKG family protein n=1 Tax=Streptomyces geranii TaxID=2058923 RepID=UPI0013009496|nr:AAWKG family protein [Streptomyces geranii]